MEFGPFVSGTVQTLLGRPGHSLLVPARKKRLSESRANPARQNSLPGRFLGQVENAAPTSRVPSTTLVSPVMTSKRSRFRSRRYGSMLFAGGWQIATENKGIGLGALQRPKRKELLAAARRRDLDAILVWRLDRWGRSLPDLVVPLKELAELRIGFVSLSSTAIQ